MKILWILILIILILIIVILIIVIHYWSCSYGEGTCSFYFKHISQYNTKFNLKNKEKQVIIYDMLDIINNYCNKIKYFPLYGTLLGFIREGKIICYDYDLDFGITDGYEWDMLKKILSILSKENPKYSYFYIDLPFARYAQLYHKETMIHCDFFVCKQKGNKIFIDSLVEKFIFDKDVIFPLKTMKVKNYYKDIEYEIKIPRYPERILKSCYGETYMIPDHHCLDDCENCVKINDLHL